jgi:hypothetical protein
VLGFVLAGAVLAGAGAPEDDAPSGIDIEFDPHGALRWDRGRQPGLVAGAGRRVARLAQRYCGSAAAGQRIRAANPGFEQPLQDRNVQIPVEALHGELRLAAVQRLFPVDRRVADGWEHWVLDPFDGDEESWEWLAELFTGSAGAAGALREANPELPPGDLRRGPPMLVPEPPAAGASRPTAPATPTPTPPLPATQPTPGGAVQNTSATVLTYATDERGPYAEYRLRRGEALYSAVVVRFTGQLAAQEVNATAREIAQRSGIADVTSIPVGYPVRVPLDLLLPQYLPADHRGGSRMNEASELAGFSRSCRWPTFPGST